MGAQIVFHLPRSWLGPLGSGVLPFYARLAEGLSARGIRFDHVPLDRDTLLDQVNADQAFHIVNHGQFRHPRVLNAGIAYVYPFWNLDPWGIRAFSSIAGQPFDPEMIDGAAARAFFRRLRQRLVRGRMSRYEQPVAPASGLPQQALAVFLQSEDHRIVGETCYLDRRQMLESALKSADTPVIVKPHPRDSSAETQDLLRELSGRHENLHVSDGNIHDILAASARVLTINSAVGIEAYLHRKPLILCGQSDFRHIAQTAKTTDELTALLARSPRKRAYDKYVYWYLGLQCLSTTESDLVGRFLQRIGASGFAL